MSDKNLTVHPVETQDTTRFFDVRQAPFRIYGLYNAQNEPFFKRMPSALAEQVSDGIAVHHRHTAGGRVRFATDSPYLHIKVKVNHVCRFSHMPLTGSAGFDLYEDSASQKSSRFVGTFVPPHELQENGTWEAKLTFRDKKQRFLTVNFPSYCGVDELLIGLEQGCTLQAGLPYSNRLPIVYYGSSITQGGCSSHPGNSYQNMVSRVFNADYINYGFSGHCLAEDNMVEYLAEQQMSVFVCDYDHNAPNAEYLQRTHAKVYERIRAKHPDVPFIMLSRPDFNPHDEQCKLRRDVVIDTFRKARKRGDQNVYYIDGEGLFRGEFGDCCTVEGCHPNDLGFSKMADSIICTLRDILVKTNIFE